MNINNEQREIMTNTQKTHYCPECERLAKENERLREALKLYGKHRNDDVMMCEKLKHSDNPCTCDFDEVIN